MNDLIFTPIFKILVRTLPRFVEISTLLQKKFTIYGHGGHLGHVTCINITCIIYIHIGSSFPSRCFIQNLALIGNAVSEKNIFEIVDRRQTDAGA